MKILLVYPDIHTIQFYHFQHGLAWISAVLKQAGHQVELLYLDREISVEMFVEKVRASAADLVGFSSITLQYQFTRRYAQGLKQALKIPLVIGGIHATVAPEEVMQEGIFDFLIRGEGEYPLLELVQALETGRDWRQIQNLWWREGDEIKFNPNRAPIDLDQLPFPDRELFDENRLLKENFGQLTMMASRGCIFACSYCCNSVLTELAGGAKKWHRQRKVEKVIEELKIAHQRCPDIKSIIFMDEVFTAERKWVREFCLEYQKHFHTPFQIYVRVGTVDYDTLKLLRETGLYSILVGVESGDEKIRRDVLNRRMSNEKIIELFKWADELGIETWSLNMIGVPGETERTIQKTIKLNQKIFPSHLQLSVFQPFPGIPLYERCMREGLIPEGEATAIYLNQPRLNLPGISRERLRQLYDEFVALGWLWEAKKGKKGYLDLSAEFDRAKIHQAQPGFVMLWLVRILGEDRLSILIHPDSMVSWRVKLKKNSRLKFGAGFSPDVWDKPGAGCWYLVKVKTRFGPEQTLFSKYLDPKHKEDERRWNDFEVDLSRFGEKKVELKLETKVDNGNEYCVAFWSRPHLIQGEKDGTPG